MKSVFLPERDCFRVTSTRTGGVVNRLMCPIDYLAFISAAFCQGGVSVESLPVICPEDFPKEFQRAKFDFVSFSGCVAFRLPSGKYPVLFRSRENGEIITFLVQFPDTIWHFNVREHRVTDVALLCCFDEQLNDDTELWRLPLPNCYDNGRICIGGNVWTMEKFSDFHELVGRFFSAPHNGDLFRAGEYGMGLSDLMCALEKDGVTINTAKPAGTLGELKRDVLKAYM